MTAKQKLQSVERQIGDCMQGLAKEIVCPYCKAVNTASENALCCADMGLAVRAILRRQAQMECVDSAARILDAVADASARN